MNDRSVDTAKRPFSRLFPYEWRMMTPLLAVMVIILAYPIVYSAWLSFRNVDLTRPGRDAFAGFDQYAAVLKQPLYWTALTNTFIFVAVAVTLELILGMALAVSLKKQKRFRDLTRAILLTPMFVTPIAVGLMFRFLLNNQLGLVPAILQKLGISIDFFSADLALLSLALIDVWQWTPFMMLMLLAGLENLPEEPHEAAYVDGANAWQTFIRVTVPMMKPIILVAVLIRALDALKVFEYVYAITRGGPGSATETLQFFVYKIGFGYYRLSEAAAVSWTVVILVMAVLVVSLWRTTRGRSA